MNFRGASFFLGLLLFIQAALFPSSWIFEEYLWSDIQPLKENGTLEMLIQERLEEIRLQKESWRLFIKQEEEKNSEFFSSFIQTIQTGTLSLEPEGLGAAYIAYDDQSLPKFIVKPVDEEIFCLNNSKYFASPFSSSKYQPRKNIPLYRSAHTDALCYEIAKACSLENITPKASLSIISHPHFFFLPGYEDHHLELEKLCSVQEYLEGTVSLKVLLEELFTQNLTEEDLQERFDQTDFEQINLFLWLTFDNDAHPENFRAYPKYINDDGQTVYGIQKIDNSLSFPERNTGFSNALMFFPNALVPLSSQIRKKIENIPIEDLKMLIRKFGLTSSLSAFEERVSTLQKLIERKDLTYYECSLRLALLEKPDGIFLALSDKPLEHLEFLAKNLMKIRRIFSITPTFLQ